MDTQNNYNTQERTFDSPNHQQQTPMAKPDSNLVWGILCTCFCCLPLGIVSIVYASKVDSYWTIGLYNEAADASRKARNWALWGAVGAFAIAFAIALCYLLIFGAAMFALNS